MEAIINGQVGFNKGFSKNSLLGFPKQRVISGVSAYGQAGITNWLDAGRLDTITLNAGRVSRWIDWVGGVDFTQNSAGQQPLYNSSYVDFNGKPSVQADTNVRHLVSVASIAQMFLQGKWFLACVLKPTAFNVNALGMSVFGFYGVFLDIAPLLMWFASTNNQIRWGDTITVSETSNLNPYIVIITSEGKICLNGVITTFPSNFNNKERAIIRLFRSVQNVALVENQTNFLGHIGELIVGSGEMNDADIIRWSNNINANYLIY